MSFMSTVTSGLPAGALLPPEGSAGFFSWPPPTATAGRVGVVVRRSRRRTPAPGTPVGASARGSWAQPTHGPAVRATPSGRAAGSRPGPSTADRGPYSTSSVISSPGWAGRQCSAIASVARPRPAAPRPAGRAPAAGAAGRRPASPMLTHTSAYTACAPAAASAGSRSARPTPGRPRPAACATSGSGGSSAGVATTTSTPALRAQQHQRAGHVVAVAHVGQLQALQVAEALAQRQQVGQRLAGMVLAR